MHPIEYDTGFRVGQIPGQRRVFDEAFDFHRDNLESPRNRAYLENLLANKVGFPVRIRFEVAPGNGPPPKEAPRTKQVSTAQRRKLIKSNPVIQAALETFQGTVIDIKE